MNAIHGCLPAYDGRLLSIFRLSVLLSAPSFAAVGAWRACVCDWPFSLKLRSFEKALLACGGISYFLALKEID